MCMGYGGTVVEAAQAAETTHFWLTTLAPSAPLFSKQPCLPTPL